MTCLQAGMLALSIGAALPAADYARNIFETANADGQFSTSPRAGERAGAAPWLRSPRPAIVFAPNDAAFAEVPKPMLDDLMKPADLEKLKLTVGNHAVVGLVTADDIDRATQELEERTVLPPPS